MALLDWIAGPKLPKPLPKGTVDRPSHYPDWKALIEASQLWPLRRPGHRGRVLIATNVGGHAPASMFEATVAAALALRDAEVEIVLCDGILAGCLKAELVGGLKPEALVDRKMPETLCPGCLNDGRAMFEPLGLKVRYLSELVTDRDLAELEALAVSGAETALRDALFGLVDRLRGVDPVVVAPPPAARKRGARG